MVQFFELKARQPDALLFFRMGDFYEVFFDDAIKAAEILGIAQTHRGTHAGKPIPMAGVPVHAAEAYLARLIRAGLKVAVCEQMEDPAEARKRGSKSVVRRDIVRVVTAGTLTEDSLLDARGANRLVSVAVRSSDAALVSVELSTGIVESLAIRRDGLAASLASLQPSEVLISDRLLADDAIMAAVLACGGRLQPLPSNLADPVSARARAEKLYGVHTLDGFGEFSTVEVVALGLVASHLEITQGGRMPVLRVPRRTGELDAMLIDPATRFSLEIDKSTSGQKDGSLLSAIDRTLTSAGARLLAERLSRPLVSPELINRRLDVVQWFVEGRSLRSEVRAVLSGTADLARSLTRLLLGRGGPRDLAAIRDTLANARTLFGVLQRQPDPLQVCPQDLLQVLDWLRPEQDPAIDALLASLTVGLADDLPSQVRDGGFVRTGVLPQLDTARQLRDDSRRVIAQMESDLVLETGLPLKIRHNVMLGYYIEVAGSRADALLAAPHDQKFIHRQTMANQKRFTTVELSELDSQIVRAADHALSLELEQFEHWRQQLSETAINLQSVADALAAIDVGSALAEWAEDAEACRPVITNDLVFEARGARHSVVEMSLRREGKAFTPNDCRLDGAAEHAPRQALVTGPNMAGKSTYLRQNALLAVLAQAGSYVPATSLRLGVVDRLFSRVGAGDDLARGRSTFMTEMVETAAILTQATSRSLVILDEIGRGTATWDGLAIAWAVAEALSQTNQSRTLFATHYHELAALEGRLEGVANLSLKAQEWQGDLVFLHEVGPGAADRSYGVQVARLAGVPAAVVARALVLLADLEGTAASKSTVPDLPLFANLEPEALHYGVREDPLAPSARKLIAELEEIEPDDLTPKQALDHLYRLKRLIH
jgi:DNA mismatch repair protein MutS